jgi:hypothetical protein
MLSNPYLFKANKCVFSLQTIVAVLFLNKRKKIKNNIYIYIFPLKKKIKNLGALVIKAISPKDSPGIYTFTHIKLGNFLFNIYYISS